MSTRWALWCSPFVNWEEKNSQFWTWWGEILWILPNVRTVPGSLSLEVLVRDTKLSNRTYTELVTNLQDMLFVDSANSLSKCSDLCDKFNSSRSKNIRIFKLMGGQRGHDAFVTKCNWCFVLINLLPGGRCTWLLVEIHLREIKLQLLFELLYVTLTGRNISVVFYTGQVEECLSEWDQKKITLNGTKMRLLTCKRKSNNAVIFR